MPVLEPDEIRLRRYERLAEYAKHTFEFHMKRWDDNETKVGRFVTMLLALLGAGAFSVWRVAHVAATVPCGWRVFLWLQCYALFALCALVSFAFYLWAFYYRRFQGPSPHEWQVLPFFENMKYVDVLVGLSKGYLAFATRAEECSDAVQRAAHRGYLWLIGAFLFGLLSALGYAIIYRDIEHAGRTEAHAAAVPSTVPANPGAVISPVH